MIPHITNEIKSRIQRARRGDAGRRRDLARSAAPSATSSRCRSSRRSASSGARSARRTSSTSTCTLVPFIEAAGELKTKPTQHSVNELRRIGIHPDIVVCRSHEELLATTSATRSRSSPTSTLAAVIACPDVPDVYLVPAVLQDEGLDELVCEQLGLDARAGADLGEWRELIERIGEPSTSGRDRARRQVREAPRRLPLGARGAQARGRPPRLRRFACAGSTPRTCRSRRRRELLEQVDGVLVPGGFGSRGWEGKILACRVAREQRDPVPRHLPRHARRRLRVRAQRASASTGANSTEMDPETPYPVIDLLPEQKEIEDLGGTMRLGAQAVELAEGTRAARGLRRRRDPRAPPAPLRGEQPLPPAARRRRARRLGHVPGGAPRRDRRAARPSVVRREPVPPGVQVAADAAGAALPRVRRRRARAGSLALRPSSLRRPASRCRPASRRRVEARRAWRASLGAASVRRAGCPRSSERRQDDLSELARPQSPNAARPTRATARPGPRGRGGRRRRRIGSNAGNLLCRLPGRMRRRDADLPLRAPRHRAAAGRARAGRRRTASSGTPRERSSARTTSRPSSRWSRRRAGSSRNAGHMPASSCCFTQKEEVGLLGAGAFDHTKLEAELGFVYDQAAPIGEVIIGAPYGRALSVRFHGRPAHSGMVPEEGRSAIAAAARAIADLRLGRLDDETTANVGTITGGSARNIVPEWCELEAEARSHDARQARRPRPGDARHVRVRRERRRVRWSRPRSARRTRATASRRATRSSSSPPPRSRRAATTLAPTLTGGGADANVFNDAGLPCLNLANGMAEIHTADEHIAVDDLDAMVDVTLALVDAAEMPSALDAEPSRRSRERAGRARPARGRRDRLRRLPADDGRRSRWATTWSSTSRHAARARLAAASTSSTRT